MSDYLTFAGIVQFDPKKRETKNGDLREVAIRLTNHPDGRMVQIALWDSSFEDVKVAKGDFVAVDGKFSSRVVDKDDGTSVTYYNCQAQSITVIPATAVAAPKGADGPRQVANKKSSEPAF